MRRTFDPYRANVYSQNGEDGILAEILRRLDITDPGVCVEFGAGNGRNLSNTLRLTERGWKTVLIEQNEASSGECQRLAVGFPAGQVTVLWGTVGYGDDDNLDVFLGRTDIPAQVDVMSIDVDSFDLQVWRAVRLYRSRVVVIEINSSIPVGEMQEHGDGKQGASFSSMLKLGEEKGYTLVYHTGNLIFVDAEDVHLLGLSEEEREHPETIFDDMWVKWGQP